MVSSPPVLWGLGLEGAPTPWLPHPSPSSVSAGVVRVVMVPPQAQGKGPQCLGPTLQQEVIGIGPGACK